MATDAWRNWQAFLIGEFEYENCEDELHSDAAFNGEAVQFGPYNVSAVSRKPVGSVSVAIIVRTELRADLMPKLVVDGKLTRGHTSGYHGGHIGDELAALISLELGVRVRFAGTRRTSGIHHINSHNPPMYQYVPNLTLPGPVGREMIPRVLTRRTDLCNLPLLRAYPNLNERHQAALVRAARSYSNALWWANQDPNQSWLQLVTAVEAAAKASRRGKEKVTGAFTKFVVQRNTNPPAPHERPLLDVLDWARMEEHVRTIYRHRSSMLHEGTPFPMPMLERPVVEGTSIQETPSGLSSGGQGGIWHSSQTPMLLSTFEYIARASLCAWWREIGS